MSSINTMLRLSAFFFLLATTLAQSGYEYNKPGKTFGQTTKRPGFSGYPTSTPSYPSTPQDEYTGTGTPPGYSSGPSTYINYRPQTGQPGQPAPGYGGPIGPTGYPIQPETNFPGQPTQNYPGQNYPIQGNGRPQGFKPNKPGFNPGENGFDNGAYEGGDYSAIPGEPGIDYPIYLTVPPTSFRCEAQRYPGYYADVETRCQAFHVCANNITYDFLCPNGTIFSQEVFVCVWWNQFDCNLAPSLYELNANLYDYSIIGSQRGHGYPQGPGFYPESSGPQSGINGPEGPSSAYPGTFPSTGYPGSSPTVGYPGSYSTTPSYQGSIGTQGIPTYPGTGPSGLGPETNNYPGSNYPTPTDQGFTPQGNYPGSQGPPGYSTIRPESQGYPSGKPSGPRFPSGPHSQNPSNSGYPVDQINREYLPPVK